MDRELIRDTEEHTTELLLPFLPPSIYLPSMAVHFFSHRMPACLPLLPATKIMGEDSFVRRSIYCYHRSSFSPSSSSPTTIINDDTPTASSSLCHPLSPTAKVTQTHVQFIPILIQFMCMWPTTHSPRRGDIAPQQQQYNMTTDGHSMSSSTWG